MELYVLSTTMRAGVRRIRLRELLRADPVAREMYSAGKEELAQRFADDRKAYTKAKEPLVDRVLIRATAQ